MQSSCINATGSSLLASVTRGHAASRGA
jgi:hypothetical protein